MKNKLLTAVVLTGILGSSLYAFDYKQNGSKNERGFGHQKMMKKGMHKKGQRGPLSVLKKLNLTDEQKMQIRNVKKEMMTKKESISVAFTDTTFDKQKFIDIMKNKKENRLERQADMIEKVYAILTPKQKSQFKVLVELQEEKKHSKFNKMGNSFGKKDCDGRKGPKSERGFNRY